MTSRKFFTLFIVISGIAYATHALVGSFQNNWPLNKIYLFDGIVLLFYFVASLTLIPTLNGNKENIVMRFMALTTLQFLAGMSLLLYIIYSQMDAFRLVALNTLAFFVAILVIQSILILFAIRK